MKSMMTLMLPKNQQDKANTQLNDLYINAVLKRDALFQIVGSDIEESSLENGRNLF